MHYIILCRSMTLAQRAANILHTAGVFASVTKAPQSANPGGCTYGVKVGAHNLDCTVLAQAPKLAPHIAAMRKNLANACGVSVSAVSVKATTEEGLGFTGAGEGIAAHAVCLLEE